jgi:hypothetical protein
LIVGGTFGTRGGTIGCFGGLWLDRARAARTAEGCRTWLTHEYAGDADVLGGERRARLRATFSERWCAAQVPVLRRGSILPRSDRNRRKRPRSL